MEKTIIANYKTADLLKTGIYALKNSATNDIIYIGIVSSEKSHNSFIHRIFFYYHGLTKNSYYQKDIQDVFNKFGLTFSILYTAPKDMDITTLRSWESYAINRAKLAGYKLANKQNNL